MLKYTYAVGLQVKCFHLGPCWHQSLPTNIYLQYVARTDGRSELFWRSMYVRMDIWLRLLTNIEPYTTAIELRHKRLRIRRYNMMNEISSIVLIGLSCRCRIISATFCALCRLWNNHDELSLEGEASIFFSKIHHSFELACQIASLCCKQPKSYAISNA